MTYLILGILPYFTVLIFIGAMVQRLYVWSKTPQPGAMTLTPAPDGESATFFGVIKDSFLFPGLFKSDRTLWIFAWFFHVTFALIIIGHIRVFTDFPRLWAALGINADRMSAVSGGTAGVIILACAIALFVRRFMLKRVREVSGVPDYFALLLILAVVVSGNIMRFDEHFDLAITRTYFQQLFTFSLSSASMPQNLLFTTHFLLGQVLIMIIPFSKIMHLGGIFFTQALIQKA